jgi:hypothetical protein
MADFKQHHFGAVYAVEAAAPNVVSTFILDGTTDAWECIFAAATTDAITHVGFRVSAEAGTATTWKASIQGVTTTDSGTTGGVPDGTIKGGGSPASVTFDNTAVTASTFNWLALDNSYTPAYRGEPLALVVTYDSGTGPSAGTNTITFNRHGSTTCNYPYTLENNAGTRSRASAAGVFGYKTASGVYGFPVVTITTVNFNSGSSPNEYALRFLLPGSGTYRVIGFRFHGSMGGGVGRLFRGRLYSGTTVLQDTTDHDGDIVGSTTSTTPFEQWFDEATISDLDFGTEYRLAIAPQNANGVLLTYVEIAAAADMAAFPGGTDFFLSHRAGGAWTDVDTRRPQIDLIIDDMTMSGGGGVSGSRIFTGF